MPHESLLLLHSVAGALGILAAVWLLVDTLNASLRNHKRIRTAGWAVAIFIWLAYLLGGYWYVNYYAPDKALILAGPWPFAHSLVMETKEHLFLSLLLLATYMPLATTNDPALSAAAKRLIITCATLVILLGLAMEGAGAIIALGVKLALLPH